MDRLRQRADFLAVANGARAGSAAFVVQSRERDDDGPIRRMLERTPADKKQDLDLSPPPPEPQLHPAAFA